MVAAVAVATGAVRTGRGSSRGGVVEAGCGEILWVVDGDATHECGHHAGGQPAVCAELDRRSEDGVLGRVLSRAARIVVGLRGADSPALGTGSAALMAAFALWAVQPAERPVAMPLEVSRPVAAGVRRYDGRVIPAGGCSIGWRWRCRTGSCGESCREDWGWGCQLEMKSWRGRRDSAWGWWKASCCACCGRGRRRSGMLGCRRRGRWGLVEELEEMMVRMERPVRG